MAEIYHQKEIYWRQRSKHLWFQCGDFNMKYFHTSATIQRKNEWFISCKLKVVSKKNRENGLHELMGNYFQNIFSSTGTEVKRVISEVPCTISETRNKMLLDDIKPEEAKSALFSMNSDKAHGLDVFTPGFYKKWWPIIGNDVVNWLRNSLTKVSCRRDWMTHCWS